MNTHVQRSLAALAVVGTFGMAAWAGSAIASATPNEDESGWNCATMGNRVCGSDDGIALETVTSGWWKGNLVMRDCTVTDSAGHRADFATVCDAYWR